MIEVMYVVVNIIRYEPNRFIIAGYYEDELPKFGRIGNIIINSKNIFLFRRKTVETIGYI